MALLCRRLLRHVHFESAFQRKNSRMSDAACDLAVICDYPPEPLALFRSLCRRLDNQPLVMNLATVDSEYGVLNRSVVYRGLTDRAVTFVTERNSRKYTNLLENPKVGLTFYLPWVPAGGQPHGDAEGDTWQVRLLDAQAHELHDQQVAALWAQEPLFAKLRSHLCVCGAPVEHAELQARHDALLADYRCGRNPLDQTNTYTAFKVVAKRWDFYKGQKDKIADRVQYSRADPTADTWQVGHVAA